MDFINNTFSIFYDSELDECLIGNQCIYETCLQHCEFDVSNGDSVDCEKECGDSEPQNYIELMTIRVWAYIAEPPAIPVDKSQVDDFEIIGFGTYDLGGLDNSIVLDECNYTFDGNFPFNDAFEDNNVCIFAEIFIVYSSGTCNTPHPYTNLICQILP